MDKRGYTEEEAKHQIAIRRPSNGLYWVNKGYSEEEAQLLKINHQKKAANVQASLPMSERYENSPWRIEYWIKRGLSEEDAKKEVSTVQSTFSLEKCICRYGNENGTRIWKDRQDNWQHTLKNKSDIEICKINKSKSHTLDSYLGRGLSMSEAIKQLT